MLPKKTLLYYYLTSIGWAFCFFMNWIALDDIDMENS